MSTYRQLPQHNNDLMKSAVSNHVVTAGIDISDLIFYNGGVYDNKYCSSGINHAIVIVGYGVRNGIPYWKLRNSWGNKWGEAGYFNILRYNGIKPAI